MVRCSKKAKAVAAALPGLLKKQSFENQLCFLKSVDHIKSFRERSERRLAVSGQRAAPGAYVST
ncbi:hypothetical protein VC35_14780 [Pseudomonas fluorescens]|uniref:Uncharacterized protein n=1 Tax=Pseudomonas fluorescens TaxID=294 RepID=A0A0F4TLL5_PSEFL|nr:hypothetical protein VC35_14780 [Pseudomonas fluorescens]